MPFSAKFAIYRQSQMRPRRVRACVDFLQLTCQFIRLVRHCLEHKTLWPAALPLFQQRLYAYL